VRSISADHHSAEALSSLLSYKASGGQCASGKVNYGGIEKPIRLSPDSAQYTAQHVEI